MKKLLLFTIATSITLFVSAQQSNLKAVLSKSHTVTKTQITGEEPTTNNRALVVPHTPKSVKRTSKADYTEKVIGTTKYDLQTNSSIGRRLIVYSDGRKTALYTFSSNAASDYQDRGTGYVHFDGKEWSAMPTDRIEGKSNPQKVNRTAWPCMYLNAKGEEVIIAQNAGAQKANGSEDPGKFTVQSKNTAIGSNTFTKSFPLDFSENFGIWNRVATSGNGTFVHIINNGISSLDFRPSDSSTGLFTPMFYYRSIDGGDTYTRQLLPEHDSSNYYNNEGDAYAIAVRDSIVAISYASFCDDVTIWKSMDNGASFTRLVVDKFPIRAFHNQKTDINKDGKADTLSTTSGDHDIIIDAAGKVHIVYGKARALDTANDDPPASIFYGNALVHWTEGMTKSDTIAQVIECDRDNSGSIDFGVIGQYGGYGYVGYVGQPSLSMDSNGDIYMVYTGAVEGDTTLDGNQEGAAAGLNFRDLFVVYSTDNGKTWSKPIDITSSPSVEEVFASAAVNTQDGKLHVLFQRDDRPGYIAGSGVEIPVANDIVYMGIPTSGIKTNVQGCASLSGINNVKPNTIGLVAYPNPAANNLNVAFETTKSGNASIIVSNTVGQVVLSQNFGTVYTGRSVQSLDIASLNNGIYFYTVTTANGVATAQFVVAK